MEAGAQAGGDLPRLERGRIHGRADLLLELFRHEG